MRAIVRENYGGPEQLHIKDADIPLPAIDEVRIRVRAFGVNRAETYMRHGSWGDVSAISGIECVGEIDLDPTRTWSKGQRVAAVMGGLGRTRPGSYAEYTCAPRSNVFPIESNLDWQTLAAIPESFATAWWCLFRSMRLERGNSLLIRGASSALGRAAISLASNAGATVVAATRSKTKVDGLRALGAVDVLVEGSEFASHARTRMPSGFNCVLELLGNNVVRESLKLVKPGGALCLAGFLAGPDPIEQFNPIVDLPSDVRFTFFGSFNLGNENYPASAIPMQQIVERVERGEIDARPAVVLSFDQIAEAHRLVESNSVEGKIVIDVGDQ